MSNIQLICFDLDDTLWPCLPTILHAEESLYHWLCNNKPVVTNKYSIKALRDKRLLLAESRPELKHNLSKLRKVSLYELAEEFNDKADWIDTAFDIFYEARQRVSLFDDVTEVLQRLSQVYELAAMTNGNADIHRTEIGHFFKYSITAEKTGAAKPDKLIFSSLLQQSALSPKQILYIGDHPVQDIEGAHKAGIPNVWLNRQKQDWPHQQITPDNSATDLYEVLALLAVK